MSVVVVDVSELEGGGLWVVRQVVDDLVHVT